MKTSKKIGVSFGLTSGIITTLGLIVGMNSATHSKTIIIGAIITIAIADAMSDALGIHVAQESQKKVSHKKAWESTTYTFITKFITALTFIIPVYFLEISQAIIVSIIWGLTLLSIFSYKIAKSKKTKPSKVIAEHIAIAIIVIILTHYVGELINLIF